jgi:AmmeMemoRadiSam system protein B/AmmeMemoRadiSam system protein A
MKKYLSNFLLLFLIYCQSCLSQVTDENKLTQPNLHNLKPVFAGQFYPADKTELEQNLTALFTSAKPQKADNVAAIIVPHAGYVFSGKVSASGFNQINPDKFYENVFILASSHRAYFEGASIYSIGNCETPLGELKVNIELVNKLMDENKYFSYVPEAYVSEHSIEVQLPFIQYRLKPGFQIVPIVIGTQFPDICLQLAKTLKPYFNENNLFVISSDFSHYPEYEDANKWDRATAEAILTNDFEEFLKTINDPSDDKVPNLATRACGWTSILTLLYITEQNQNIEYSLIDYENSGDSDYGDKERVVGYNSIAVSYKNEHNASGDFFLSDQDKRELLYIARSTIVEFITSKQTLHLQPTLYSKTLKTPCGAFVTLHKNNELRGCLGRFDAVQPLYEVVQEMAIASSTQDVRFLPVSKDEIKDIEIEISVLSPIKQIKSIEEIQLGKHGIYIKKGNRSGTFLPQVATETGWTLEEFLSHCSRDKAGLGWDGWKDAEIFTYEAIVFSEAEFINSKK